MENSKNCFIEAKIYQLTELVIPHQTLFQHQLAYVWPTIKLVKLFTQNVTNTTFILKPLQMQNLMKKRLACALTH